MTPTRPVSTTDFDAPPAFTPEAAAARLRLNPDTEVEYARIRLLSQRTLIRAACTLALMLVTARIVEQWIGGAWARGLPMHVATIAVATAVLATLAWSRGFERFYLPFAYVAVPLRNVLGAAVVAVGAAHGQNELLMALPLMVLGPFFFLGFGSRAALACVAVTITAFVVAATAFDLAMSTAMRAYALLIVATLACAVAAFRHERLSRQRFLEGHVLANLAEHDALTGLSNRRVFDERLEHIWQSAIAERCTIAIALVDIDHFKAYNDVNGHQAGDRALQRVAHTLRTFISGSQDVLARYGGEEFAIIIYDVEAVAAEALAARMVRAVRELELGIAPGNPATGTTTISAGVAVVDPVVGRDPKGAVQLADQALYEAKTGGRDRVVVLDHAAYDELVTGVFATRSSVSETYPAAPARPPPPDAMPLRAADGCHGPMICPIIGAGGPRCRLHRGEGPYRAVRRIRQYIIDEDPA